MTSSAQDLAHELFLEGNWAACLRECQRTVLEQGAAASPRLRLLELSCRARLTKLSDESMLLQLNPLILQTNDTETSAIASFESGRIYWSQDNGPEAFERFAFSFQTTTNLNLFLQSACSAFLVLNENPSIKAHYPDLVQQINTSRDLWTGELFGVCRINKNEPQLRIDPSDWIVRFYRRQISPAIGQRCNLEPSCSEYFRLAACRHSLLSVPMIGDRFIREPTVSNQKKEPVFIRGMMRYKDTLDEHDFWMRE